MVQPTPGPRVIAVEATEPPEPPEPPRPPKTHYPIGLELNFMPVWLTGAGYDLFSTNNVSTRIGLAADLELVDIAAKTPLSIEAGWSTESQSASSLGGELDAQMVAHNLHGGLKLQHRVLSFLAPHVRAAAGATSLGVDFSTLGTYGSREFSSHDWLAFGSVGAGVTATIPARFVLRPGLSVEGGYLFSGSMPLRLEPQSDAQSITTSGAALGTLKRSGPYLRIGIFVRY
jgi:hypothetical protein